MKVAHPVMKMAVCAVVGATALAACSKSSHNNTRSTDHQGRLRLGARPDRVLRTPARSPSPSRQAPPRPGSSRSRRAPTARCTPPTRSSTRCGGRCTSSRTGRRSKRTRRMSMASDPTWSNGNKTVTVKLKNWKWSDGQPVTSKDAEFFIDMTRAAVKVSAGGLLAVHAEGRHPRPGREHVHAGRPHPGDQPEQVGEPDLVLARTTWPASRRCPRTPGPRPRRTARSLTRTTRRTPPRSTSSWPRSPSRSRPTRPTRCGRSSTARTS